MKLIVIANLLLLCSGLVVVPAIAATSCWTLLPERSHLTFTGDQAGAPAHGEFKQFGVTFCFNPDSMKGDLQVKVAMASLETHNSKRDKVLRGENFFATTQFPYAVYQADHFTRDSKKHYTAQGTLTIRDVSRRVAVPFAVSINGGVATVRGKKVIQRFDFGVGQGRWGNTRWVGNDVELGFELRLTPQAQ